MTTRTFEIKPAADQDARVLAELGAKTFRDTFAPYNRASDMEVYLTQTFREDFQAEEIADPRRKIYIAWCGSDAVGYLHLVRGSSDRAVTGPDPIELLRLYVEASFHGTGVAASLMQTAIETTSQLGCKTLWLGVWEQNFRAQAFYKKWAFKEVGSHIFQLGTDPQRDLIMQRHLHV